jgi:hypothetical protein
LIFSFPLFNRILLFYIKPRAQGRGTSTFFGLSLVMRVLLSTVFWRDDYEQ